MNISHLFPSDICHGFLAIWRHSLSREIVISKRNVVVIDGTVGADCSSRKPSFFYESHGRIGRLRHLQGWLGKSLQSLLDR